MDKINKKSNYSSKGLMSFVFLVFVFCFILPQTAGAIGILYQPGDTLDPACGPTEPGCGVAIFSLNGLDDTTQTLVAGIAGTDFTIVDSGLGIHTFNIPDASALARGLLTAVDWLAFNGKQDALVSGTNIKTVGGISLLGSGDVAVGTGTVTSVTSANGDATVATTTTTPVITIVSAPKLTTARLINGVSFDGTSDITVVDATKVVANGSITGATKTKITYDTKGLITAGADATTADIATSTDKNYVTDAGLVVLGNTSSTNTGDNAVNSLYSGLVGSKQDLATNLTSLSGLSYVSPSFVKMTAAGTFALDTTVLGTLATQSGTFSGTSSGTNTGDNAVNSLYSGLVTNATHTGDATGATALTVVALNGINLAGLATGILKNTTGTGVPSIAVAGDFPTLNQNTTGNAGTATNLTGLTATISNLNTLTGALGSNAFLSTAFAPIASPTFTGTVSGITASMVGAPSGSGTSSGTNTGDQTITLTGGVTGSGTGSFAATVITNANLTGAITSAGNATSLGSFSSTNLSGALSDETGSGLAVFATSPTLVTPVLGVATATSITGTTTLVLNSTGANAVTLDSTTTGAVNLGTGTSAKNISIGGIGANVITIGNTQTAGSVAIGGAMTGGTINIGNSSAAMTGSINIGGSTGAQIVTLGGGGTGIKTVVIAGGTAANSVTIANNQNGGVVQIGSSMTTGTIAIGGAAQTGDMSLGASSATNNMYIANGAGATTLRIANVQTAGAVNIGAGMTTGTITIGGTSAQTGTITFGGGTGAQIVNLGTGGTGIKTLHIGDGGVANVITLGSTTGAATTTIQSGTGNVNFIAGPTSSSSNVRIGNSATTTPDLLVLDNGTADPTGTNGGTYYNTSTNKFRCFQNSAWANCIGGDKFWIPKSTDQSITSTTTLTSDTALTFSVGSGETWVFGFDLFVTNGSSAQPDLKTAILGAAGWTCSVQMSGTEANGAAFPQVTTTDCDNAPTAMVNAGIGDDGGDGYTVHVQGTITTNSVGSVTLQFAQNTSSLSALTIKAGSFVEAFKVNGADLAEMYYGQESLTPGTVVSIDPSLSSGVKRSEGIYDKNLLGVVTTNPGMVLGDSSASSGIPVLVALSGRTPVNVSTENGSIEIGDYLTSSSTPGVAMKSNGRGPVIGQAISSYEGEGIGTVTVFIKNFDIGGNAVLMGDISPLVNADGGDNGLSTLVDTIQSENARNPVTIISQKITDGTQFLTDFVVARVTALRGYFDEVFAKKVHTEQLCVKKSDGSEVCVNGDDLNSLLPNADIAPVIITEPSDDAPVDDPGQIPSEETPPTEESIDPVVVEPTPTPEEVVTPEPALSPEEPANPPEEEALVN